MGLDVTGLGAIFDFGKAVLDRFVPDPAMKLQATLEMQKAAQEGELAKMAEETQLAQGQIDVNKVEAASGSTFVSGWRPFVGWVCGCGFAMTFVIGPLLEWGGKLAGHAVTFPVLDTGTMITLLFGMLGLGGLRTIERVKGVIPPQPPAAG